MWANAQCDGRPAKYRWRPLFNATKFGWRPLLDCRAVTLPRRESGWNLQGCPKITNRCQPLVGQSSPYCREMWGRYCCLTSFFPIVADFSQKNYLILCYVLHLTGMMSSLWIWAVLVYHTCTWCHESYKPSIFWSLLISGLDWRTRRACHLPQPSFPILTEFL